MKEKYTITFNKILEVEKRGLDYYKQVFENAPYSEEEGWGFSSVEEDEYILSATLLKRTPTSIQEWNIQQRDFEKKVIYIYTQFSFSIDFRLGLIYVQGTISALNKIKSILRNVLKGAFSYDDITLSSVILSPQFRSNDFQSLLKEISINDFNYKEGIIGKYVAKIHNQENAIEIVDKYFEKISKIKIYFYSQNTNFELIASRCNSLTIICDCDDFFLIMDKVKNFIK